MFLEVDTGCVLSDAFGCSCRDQIQPHLFEMRLYLTGAGELDQCAEERGQFLGLPACLRDELPGVGRLQTPRLVQELQVRTETGQRSGKLVRGVGDELALRSDGALERGEHR